MQTAPVAEPPPAPPAKRRRRFLRRAALLAAVPVAFILGLPWLLSTDFVRTRVEAQMADAFGAEVTLTDYRLSWFSGFTLEELIVGNPEGFDASTDAIRVRGARGDFALLPLFTGHLSFDATVDALEVRVQQLADGRSNLEALLGSATEQVQMPPESEPSGGDTGGGPVEGANLDNVRFDLAISDGQVDIEHEVHGQLESLRRVRMQMQKEYGADVRLAVESELHRPGMDTPGKLGLDVDVDPLLERPLKADLSVVSLDLSRYQPLVAAFFDPGQIQEFAGMLGGSGQATLDVHENRVVVEGNLNVERPRFAGPLFMDMNIVGEHWVLSPNVELDLDEIGGPKLRLDGLRVDLGFLKLRGMTADAASAAAEGAPAVGVTFDADLAAMGRLGGPIPGFLGEQAGSADGRVVLPVEEGAGLADLGKQLVERVLAQIDLELGTLAVKGHDLTELTGLVTVSQGKAAASLTANIANGPATLALNVTPAGERWPADLELSWQSGRVHGPAVEVLRYVVPVLAGLDVGTQLDFESGIGCKLNLAGLLPEDFSGLDWLNDWSGGGSLDLTEGSFTPSSQLGQLLSLTGKSRKVAFRGISTDFVLANGFISTEACKLVRGATGLALKGKTGLDGSMQYTVDLSELLREHRDGRRVLGALGGKLPEVSLAGTLDAPKVELPNLLRTLGGQGVRDTADKLLRQGLEGIFKRKK